MLLLTLMTVVFLILKIRIYNVIIYLVILMEIKINRLYKHFKGTTLVEKNIYRILATNVIYSGDNNRDISDLVIYQNIFDGKIFAREVSDLTGTLDEEKQALYQQTYRIEELTDEEVATVETEDYKVKKLKYLESKKK